jgi:uncharacterized membrane protein
MPFTHTYTAAGNYTVTLTVTDNASASASTGVLVTVGTNSSGNETKLPQCGDGIDNDGDGRVDLVDEGCTSAIDDNEGDDPSSSWPPRQVMTKRMTINRIDIHSSEWELDAAYAGGQLIVDAVIENGLDHEVEDIDLVIWVQELGLRKSFHFDLRPGKEQRVSAMFDVPFDAYPGIYDVLVEASSDEVRRVKYREFTVLG